MLQSIPQPTSLKSSLLFLTSNIAFLPSEIRSMPSPAQGAVHSCFRAESLVALVAILAVADLTGAAPLNNDELRAKVQSCEAHEWDASHPACAALPGLDTSEITDMSNLFQYATSFNADLSGWNTSAVTTMRGMFHFASSFNGVLSRWDVSSVSDMQSMFHGASSFNGNLSGWTTTSVVDVSSMFSAASTMNGDISKWDTSSIQTMSQMFMRATKFDVDLSSWDTSRVEDTSEMFAMASFFNGDISSWNTGSVIDMSNMFLQAIRFNIDVSNWDTGSVLDMSSMFEGAKAFHQDLSQWDTSRVVDMAFLFAAAFAFNGDVSAWDTTSVTNMDSMFSQAISFNRDISSWNTSSVSDMGWMFYQASSFNIDLCGWQTMQLESDASSTFLGSPKLSFCDTNECISGLWELACHSNADCTNTDGSFTCGCQAGFVDWSTGPEAGLNCDRNQCHDGTDNCAPDATCTDTNGSFTCSCNVGFETVDQGVACAAGFDECARGEHRCSEYALCDNTIGSYLCECITGYSGDGVTCVDDNECALGTHHCHSDAACFNVPGSFTCACNTGFHGDGLTCADEDECSDGGDNCDENAGCHNTVGSFTCACNHGFLDWSASSVSGTVCDRNQCSEGTHSCDADAFCTDTAGGFTCACNDGFFGDGMTCSDIDECLIGKQDCHNLAACTNEPGTYSCSCFAGYRGDGRASCEEIDECADGLDTCDGNATCTNIVGAYTCACNFGFEGDGESCVDIDECAAGPCGGNATCTNLLGGNYACACNTGFNGDGKTCTEANECEEGTSSCGLNSICSNTVGSFTCTCLDSFVDWSPGEIGTSCDENQCSTNLHNCAPEAICTDTEGSFSCECAGGYQDNGDGTACDEINECQRIREVDVAQTCKDASGSFTATCSTAQRSTYGSGGPEKALDGIGHDGQYHSSRGCTHSYYQSPLEWWRVDLNDHLPQNELPASPHMISKVKIWNRVDCCSDRLSGFKIWVSDTNDPAELDNPNSTLCYANTGLEASSESGPIVAACGKRGRYVWITAASGNVLTLCEVEIVDDTVPDNTCDAKAQCANTDGSYLCECMTGYSGDGVTCVDDNECALGTHHCHSDAACLNVPGSFTCACNAGFHGDGLTCADEDECSDGSDDCDENAGCHNTVGSFTCSCRSGFSGSGVSCEDINECAAHLVWPSATYWRLTNLGDCGWRPAVTEMNMFGTLGGGSDLSAHGELISSGYNKGAGLGASAIGATDNNPYTKWRPHLGSPRAGEVWIGYHFDTPTVVREARAVGLGIGEGGGRTWNGGVALQYSTDGGNWTTAAFRQNSDSVEVHLPSATTYTHGCQGDMPCTNTFGSFTCGCDAGFAAADVCVASTVIFDTIPEHYQSIVDYWEDDDIAFQFKTDPSANTIVMNNRVNGKWQSKERITVSFPTTSRFQIFVTKSGWHVSYGDEWTHVFGHRGTWSDENAYTITTNLGSDRFESGPCAMTELRCTESAHTSQPNSTATTMPLSTATPLLLQDPELHNGTHSSEASLNKASIVFEPAQNSNPGMAVGIGNLESKMDEAPDDPVDPPSASGTNWAHAVGAGSAVVGAGVIFYLWYQASRQCSRSPTDAEAGEPDFVSASVLPPCENQLTKGDLENKLFAIEVCADLRTREVHGGTLTRARSA